MKKIFAALFLFLILLRVLASLRLGMTVDEAHYVLYGKNLALSYFDHPPLVGWLHFLFQLLPLHENIQARLPAMLLSGLSSWLLYLYLRKQQFSENAALTGVLAVNLTPIFNSLSIALLPDTCLLPLSLLVMLQTEKILEDTKSTSNWLVYGLYLGLCGLSKYTAFLLALSIVIIFLKQKLWNLLWRPQLWFGVFAATIVIGPVLIWNYQNDFISFKYQTEHVSASGADVFKTLISSWGIQFGSWGIVPFFLALGVHVWAFAKNQLRKSYFNFLMFQTVGLLFFIHISRNEVLLPHWMLVYFTPAVAFAVALMIDQLKAMKTIVAGLAVSGALSITLLTESAFGFLPPNLSAGLYRDIWGWKELVMQAQTHLKNVEAPNKALAVMNWTLGSRARFYADGKSEVFVLDTRYDQFDIWEKHTPVGYDLVILVESEKQQEHLSRLNCRTLKPIEEKLTTIKDVPVHRFLYYHCAQLIEVKK